MGILLLTGFIIVVMIILCIFLWKKSESDYEHETLYGIGFVITAIMIFALPILVGIFHGYINYYPSNDRDLARITAITQKQNLIKAYYEVEVEYLTSADKKVEKDTMYLYYDNEETAKKIRENLYKEVWITSGYKGGYETYKDFGTKLIKNIELKE